MVKCFFLAMTAAEFRKFGDLGQGLAWMACHFSLRDRSLSNLPVALPPHSLLILDDRIPLHGHDPESVRAQLAQTAESLSCAGILLDLERGGLEDTRSFVRELAQGNYPCPLIVSAEYAQGLHSPVFLPPLPPGTPLRDYIAPWAGREIWLDAALSGEALTLTEAGLARVPLLPSEIPKQGLPEEALHCHYQIGLSPTSARFTLWRTPEDLIALVSEAAELGISTVGLYQELAGIVQ